MLRNYVYLHEADIKINKKQEFDGWAIYLMSYHPPDPVSRVAFKPPRGVTQHITAREHVTEPSPSCKEAVPWQLQPVTQSYVLLARPKEKRTMDRYSDGIAYSHNGWLLDACTARHHKGSEYRIHISPTSRILSIMGSLSCPMPWLCVTPGATPGGTFEKPRDSRCALAYHRLKPTTLLVQPLPVSPYRPQGLKEGWNSGCAAGIKDKSRVRR
jgi:hypothetical protein